MAFDVASCVLGWSFTYEYMWAARQRAAGYPAEIIAKAKILGESRSNAYSLWRGIHGDPAYGGGYPTDEQLDDLTLRRTHEQWEAAKAIIRELRSPKKALKQAEREMEVCQQHQR